MRRSRLPETENLTNMALATVKIDGRDVTVDAGTTVLDAARKLGIEITTLCFVEEFELRQHRMETDIGSLFEAQVEADGKRVLVVDTSLNFRGSMKEYEALDPKDPSQAVVLIVSGRTGEEENMNQIAAALRGGFFARARRPARSEVRDRDVSPLDLHVQPVTVEPPVPWADERKERRKEHRQDRKKRRRNGRR
jgi:hypothetical protein